MPILTIECPDCGHTFRGLVLEGTRPPEIWVCSECGSRDAQVRTDVKPVAHPWEDPDQAHGPGLCSCCG